MGFYNFNLLIFNLRVSNPNKLIVDVFVDTMSDFNVPGSRPKKNTMKFRKPTVVTDGLQRLTEELDVIITIPVIIVIVIAIVTVRVTAIAIRCNSNSLKSLAEELEVVLAAWRHDRDVADGRDRLDSYEEFTTLAATRLARNSLRYLQIAEIVFKELKL